MRKPLQSLYLVLASYLNPVYWMLDKTANSVLDIGCGNGKNGLLLKKRGNVTITGIDIFEPSLRAARETGSYKKIMKGDITKLSFPEKSYDVVMCLQVLEHLEKQKAIELVKRMEVIAKRQVIITTPLNQLHQGSVGGNRWQKHRSHFSTEELRSRGYKTLNFGNKWMSAQEGLQGKNTPWQIKSLFLVFDLIFTPVYRLFPFFANHYFLAYKSIR